MATHPIKTARVRAPESSFLSYVIRYVPEAAEQDFMAGSPVVYTAGFITEADSPVTEIFGFALRPGQFGDADGDFLSEVVIATDGVYVIGNLLGDAGATRDLAATDLGTSVNLELGVGIAGDGSDAWYFNAATVTDAAIFIATSDTDTPLANAVSNTRSQVGDTNPRVTGVVLNSARSWNA